MVAGFYGTSQFVPQRARVIPEFVVVCAIMSWGYIAGLLIAGRLGQKRVTARSAVFSLISAGVISLAILCPLASVWHNLRLFPHAFREAKAWDEADRQIRS